MFLGFYITVWAMWWLYAACSLIAEKGNARMYGWVTLGLWGIIGWLPLIITKLIVDTELLNYYLKHHWPGRFPE